MSNDASAGARLWVLLLAPFLAQADATIANVATPSIQRDLEASATAGELVVGGYLVAYAVLLITGARLGQARGYRRVYTFGLAIFGLSSLVAGLAPDASVLVGARVVQGMGAAAMYPQALTGIQLNFTGQARTRAIALFAIALAGGAVGGQILGGVLISANIAGAEWRPIFLVNVPIALAGIIAARRVLPADSRSSSERFDGLGVLTLSVTLLLLVVPLILGRTSGWPPWAIGGLVASAPVGWLFVTSQRRVLARGGRPLIDVRAIARPELLLGLGALLLATGTYYALLFCLAQYLQDGLGRSALASGLLLVPWVTAFGLAGQVTRRLPARFQPLLPMIGYVLLGVAYGCLALAVKDAPPPDAVLIALLTLGGSGLGTGFASLIAHVTNAVPEKLAPDISGVSTTVLQIGGALGVAGFGTVYLSALGEAGEAFSITSAALALAALLSAGGAFRATRA